MIHERNRIDSRRAGIKLYPHRLATLGTNRGFSLLELVLVLGIVAILAAIAIPRHGNAVSRYRADLAARRIVQDIELAQTRARAQGAAQSIRIRQGVDEIVIFNAAGLDPHISEYCTEIWDSPYRANITQSNFDGDNYLIFDGWGVSDSGGYAVLWVGSEKRTITVDPNTGKATIE